MNEVKLELDSSETLCRVCLCTDRNVALLGELSDLFYRISNVQELEDAVIWLCWECRSILKRTWRFQQQIQQAQILLQQPDFLLKKTKEFTLSTLGKVLNENYDTIYDNKCTETDHKQCKIKEELIDEVESEEAKKEIYIDRSDTEFSDDPVINNLGNNDLVEVKNDIKTNKEYVNKEKLDLKNERRQHKYRKLATITNNDINSNNVDSYFITSLLNVKVMEEILERRKKITYRKGPHYICKICKIEFRKNIDLKRHKYIKHPPPKGPYNCSECQNFSNAPTLLDLHEHWACHSVFKCKLCPEVCRSLPEINRHLFNAHQYTYRCNYCGNSYSSFRDFIRHYKDLHEKVICDHCGKSFIKKKSLETHIRRKHLPPICYTCGRIYKSVHALESHSRLSHPELHYDLTKTELSYCVECNKQFSSVYTYKRHLGTAPIHRPPKPVSIPCPECGKVFSRKNYMNNHYKLFHVKKSRHYCELCNKYYVTAYALRNHRLRVHEKTYPPKDKICEICGRGFSTNRVLLHHTRTHTGEKPHKCSQCPAAFAQQCAKKSHERSQHKIF